MNKNASIQVCNLTTGYRAKHQDTMVTKGVNASLYRGRLTCLLGPNGAGKSTLLRTLCAFQPAMAGDIIVEGKNLKDYTERELSKVISIVLTDRLHLNDMTMEELVGMGRSPYTGFWGRLSEEDHHIIDEVIALVGIGHLHGRLMQTLSDGERQKVMIAKALAQETPIIFLDEPTAFLDYPSKVEIMQLLQQLSRKKNKTIFLSTHDLELALQIADSIWLMNKEKGLRVGNPEDLSLSGDMSSFFEHEGVVFDHDLGLFRIENTPHYPACVKGNGRRYNMVRKALERNGYFLTEDAGCSTRINVLEDAFVIGETTVYSIEELLNELNEQNTDLALCRAKVRQ
ncbi:MAG: ABC transporter ATP-binding protein [Prevotella sp.]